ncbi:hypothetical protein QUF80_06085 [Desulfococcaceae bacterium HSG8]|nr:hypothetical protein [Desulfococcaceae bacterium HSG8]
MKTSSAGEGNAGAINLIVADRVHLDTGTSVSSASESQGKSGDAGTITIIAGELEGDEKRSRFVIKEAAGGGIESDDFQASPLTWFGDEDADEKPEQKE